MVDRLDARTDWLAEQRADFVISFVMDLIRRGERPTQDDIETSPELKAYADVWPQLALEDELLQHLNERAVSTRIVVPPTLREAVPRAARARKPRVRGHCAPHLAEVLVAARERRRVRVRERVRSVRSRPCREPGTARSARTPPCGPAVRDSLH